MALGASVALTAVVISICSSPRAQGIQRQPVTINTVSAIIPATGTYWIMPFHLPNIFSIHPVKGSLMPEFSANSNLRDCNHASALATNPSGAVLLGIKVQHVVPISAYTPPCSANNISILIYSSNLIRGKLYELLLIMIYVIYPNNIFSNGGQPKQNRFKSCRYLISSCDCYSLLGGRSL